jgi:predicted MFS family arabinose efflux permease
LSVAFMLGRIFFGHLPDIVRAGSGWGHTHWPGLLARLSCLRLEAVRRAPPQNHGLAMGAYTAFLDLSLALASPVLGLIASVAGLNAVFLASTLCALCTAPIALCLLQMPSRQRKQQCLMSS